MPVDFFIEQGRSADVDDRGVSTFTRTFLARMISLSDDPIDALLVIAPPRYTSYYLYPDAVLTRASAKKADQIGWYGVELTYTDKGSDSPSDPQHGNTQAQQQSADPNANPPPARPWQIDFDSVSRTKLLTVDKAGVPVTSTAGQPFSPAVEVPTTNDTLIITAYKGITYDAFLEKQTFQNRVNISAWTPFPVGSPLNGWVFPADSVRCNSYKPKPHYEHNAWYWEIVVTLEVNWDLWNPIKLLDAGTVQKDDHNPASPPIPIIDKQGQPLQSPVPLDGAGHPLGFGAVPTYLLFQGYDRINYDNLLQG